MFVRRLMTSVNNKIPLSEANKVLSFWFGECDAKGFPKEETKMMWFGGGPKSKYD